MLVYYIITYFEVGNKFSTN